MTRAVLPLVLATLWCATAATVSPSGTTSIPIQGACPATASPVYVPVAATTFGGVAIDPGCQYVYLTNTTWNRVEIYSLQTLSFEAPIQVGAQPMGLDVTPDGSLIYVANSGGNNISVVSLAQRIELRKITVPTDGSNFSPISIAIANNGRALFSTSNGGSGSLRELVLATDVVSTRADFAANFGAITNQMRLNASRNRSKIGVASGNISSGPFTIYDAATNSFGVVKRLDAFVSEASADEDGSKFMVAPWSYVVDPSPSMTGTIIGLPVNGVGTGAGALDPTRNIGYRSVNDHVDVLNMARFLKVGELPLGTSASNAGFNNRIGRMSISADGSVLAVITNAGFSIVRPLLESPKNTNLVRNGVFDSDTTHWQTFALPDPTYIDSNVSAGTFRFNRLSPPAGQPSQAVVFQQTGMALPAGAPIQARFDLGNSSTARKRISVLLIEADFSDISVCTFWVPPGEPMATYRMRTHTTKPWTNAAIYFYAATEGSDNGFNLVDNVSVQFDPTQPDDVTECVDPTAPEPSGGPDGPELLVNGDFGTGTTQGWSMFGTLTSQVDAGVFEFARETGTLPAGVILQPTGQGIAAAEVLTATFELGNTSTVRKRVTVLLHDNDFSDLSACTFWLAPGQALSPYVMRGFATRTWTNATISFYAATVGTETWSRLDNVSLRRTPSTPIVGTECVEPDLGLAALGSTVTAAAAPGTAPTAATGGRGGDNRMSVASARRTGQAALPRLSPASPRSLEFIDASATQAFDLTNAAGARLFVQSWLPEGQGQAQISLDGVNWAALGDIVPSTEWISVETDLGAWTGHVILIRFVRAGDVTTTGQWRLRNLRLEVDRQRDRNR